MIAFLLIIFIITALCWVLLTLELAALIGKLLFLLARLVVRLTLLACYKVHEAILGVD